MKANSKKLALLMTIAVIAMFIFSTTVTADPLLKRPHPGHRAIQGQYAGTGGGTCYIAVCGFAPNLIANYASAGTWFIQNTTMQFVYTFSHDGSGTVTGTAQQVVHPNFQLVGSTPPLTLESVPGGVNVPYAAEQSFTWSFTYVIDDDRAITITEVPDTCTFTFTSGPFKGGISHVNGQVRTGVIAPDGKTIVLNGSLSSLMTVTPPIMTNPPCPTQMICGSSAVLVGTGDIDVNWRD
jgi:hypothetical protein